MMLGSIIIVAFYYLGVWTERLLHVPVPGSIIGMMYLFIYLMWRAQIPTSVQRSSNVLLANLSLILIPSCAGIVACLTLLKEEALAIMLVLSISTTLSLLLTALLLNKLSRRQ